MRTLDEIERAVARGVHPFIWELGHLFRIAREAEAHTHNVLNSDDLVEAVDAARADGIFQSFEELEPKPPPKKKKKKWVTQIVEMESV